MRNNKPPASHVCRGRPQNSTIVLRWQNVVQAMVLLAACAPDQMNVAAQDGRVGGSTIAAGSALALPRAVGGEICLWGVLDDRLNAADGACCLTAGETTRGQCCYSDCRSTFIDSFNHFPQVMTLYRK
jgi:hypothetical protein